MILIKIDDKLINAGEVWYHAQLHPNPNKHVFEIIVTLDEEKIINSIKQGSKIDVYNIFSITKSNLLFALFPFQNLNLIDCIFFSLPDKYFTATEGKWVLNKVNKIEVDYKTKELKIIGVASPMIKT